MFTVLCSVEHQHYNQFLLGHKPMRLLNQVAMDVSAWRQKRRRSIFRTEINVCILAMTWPAEVIDFQPPVSRHNPVARQQPSPEHLNGIYIDQVTGLPVQPPPTGLLCLARFKEKRNLTDFPPTGTGDELKLELLSRNLDCCTTHLHYLNLFYACFTNNIWYAKRNEFFASH